MSADVETIDSSRMKVLSELAIEYENDEEITKPDAAARTRLFVGESGDDVIVSSLSKNTGEIRGDLVIEKRNILFVGRSIRELINREKPWQEAVKHEVGKDKLLIYYSSSWAANLPAPFERVNIENKRKYRLDGLRSQVLGLNLPPKTAQKLADEIQRKFS